MDFVFIFLIRLLTEVNHIFEIPALFNFLTSVLLLCVLGFLFIFSKKIVEFIRFLFTFFGVILQIYLICAHGERLQDTVKQVHCFDLRIFFWIFSMQSSNMTMGIYSSAWYERSVPYQRALLLIMVRSQRTQKLNIWKFGTASKKAFSSVNLFNSLRKYESNVFFCRC